MNDFIDAKTVRLGATAERGSVIRSFCQHPGFKLYEQELQNIIDDKKNRWLVGTDEDAKLFRYHAQGVQLSLGILKKMILDGDLANSQLRENSEASLQAPQL